MQTWNGPFTALEDMESALKSMVSEKKVKEVLRHELILQKHMHPNDAIERKELYLINKQSVNSMSYNLSILLSNDISQSTEAEIILPSEDEIVSIIRANGDLIPTRSDLRVNEAHAVVWNVAGSIRWFIGFLLEVKADSVKMEHLVPSNSNSNAHWQYPSIDDIQVADLEQILPIDVIGDWDYSNTRKSVFIVDNAEAISLCFQDYTS